MAITKVKSSSIEDLDSTKLTGTIASARLSNVDLTTLSATNLTSGTIPDARIPASAVTQHVAAVDLSAVRQDIAMLALYNAVSDNRAAYNLPSSFIDQFEDDTGITTEITVDRNASEYVSSTTESLGTPAWDTGNRSSSITSTTNVTIVSGSFGQMVDGDVTSNQMDWNTTTATPGKYLRWQWAAQKIITGFRHIIHTSLGGGSGPEYMGTWQFQGSNDGSTWVDIGSPFMLRGATATQDYTAMSGNTTGYTYYQLENTVQPHANGNPYHKEMEFLVATASSTVNATGTLISDTQTASSATTKMSGVILYKDNAGTATLGTDLVISLSANGGTNYTEAASYGAVTPLFSTGVKMVRLGETIVTSGTTPVIKAVWANQASGSKETQLHGWAMNY